MDLMEIRRGLLMQMTTPIAQSPLQPFIESIEEVTVETAIANCEDIYLNYLGYQRSENAGKEELFIVIVKDPDPTVANAGVSFMTQNMVPTWSTNSQVIYSRYESGSLAVKTHPASYTSTALFVVPVGAKMVITKLKVFGA